MLLLFPFQEVVFVSSECWTCRLLKWLLAHPMNSGSYYRCASTLRTGFGPNPTSDSVPNPRIRKLRASGIGENTKVFWVGNARALRTVNAGGRRKQTMQQVTDASRWTHGPTDPRTHGPTDPRILGPTDPRTHGPTDPQTHGPGNRTMYLRPPDFSGVSAPMQQRTLQALQLFLQHHSIYSYV